ncbi:hypothetical protein FDF12_03415 [Clostridium botulinum]|nr:hypothetical protein [Clostridium botulinum]NFS52952.1 hypothetical protein [Clostridium botulinum]NFT16474.1 hypothetical protein [Clostridium botulinum]
MKKIKENLLKLGTKLTNKIDWIKKHKKKSTLYVVIIASILSISCGLFYKYGYINKGILMSNKTKMSRIRYIVYQKQYDKAETINNIYFGGIDDIDNKKTVEDFINYCSRTHTRNLDEAKETLKNIKISEKGEISGEYKNIGIWQVKANVINNNNKTVTDGKIKFVFKDNQGKVIDTKYEDLIYLKPSQQTKIITDCSWGDIQDGNVSVVLDNVPYLLDSEN